MAKSNFAPSGSRSAGSIDQDDLPQGDPRRAASEDELQDNAEADTDNGGGASGTRGNGSGG
jgi:hypothetical protein